MTCTGHTASPGSRLEQMPVEAKLVLPLLSFALEKAREIVAKGHQLQPFHLAMGSEGELHDVDRKTNPDRSIVADIAADRIVAVAIGTQVVESSRRRAVRILIEAPGYARCFYLPFTRAKPESASSTPNTEFGELSSRVTQPRYFILH